MQRTAEAAVKLLNPDGPGDRELNAEECERMMRWFSGFEAYLWTLYGEAADQP